MLLMPDADWTTSSSSPGVTLKSRPKVPPSVCTVGAKVAVTVRIWFVVGSGWVASGVARGPATLLGGANIRDDTWPQPAPMSPPPWGQVSGRMGTTPLTCGDTTDSALRVPYSGTSLSSSGTPSCDLGTGLRSAPHEQASGSPPPTARCRQPTGGVAAGVRSRWPEAPEVPDPPPSLPNNGAPPSHRSLSGTAPRRHQR